MMVGFAIASINGVKATLTQFVDTDS